MRQQLQEGYLAQYFWQSGGSITTQQALLGASALTHAAVESLAVAKKILVEIPQGWIALEMRFFSDGSANDVDVIQMYAASTSDSEPDHYRHFGQLTVTVGTQEYGSNKFHDTIVPSGIAWMSKTGAVSPANNTFGSFVMNTHAHSRILLIVSTLVSTTFSAEFRKL